LVPVPFTYEPVPFPAKVVTTPADSSGVGVTDATAKTVALLEYVSDKFPLKKLQDAAVKLTDESTDEKVGGVAEIEVTLLPKTLLSLHAVMFAPDNVSVLESAASNHTTHPGTLLGSNPKMFLDVPIITCLKQNIVGR
jgi:hypothetical protein